jgi:NTP pyrophosphatase (non-canonical NTP hydrolase)
MKEFEEYQRRVSALLIEPEKSSIELQCIQLASEAGEVGGQYVKIMRLTHKLLKHQVENVEAAKIPEMWEKVYKEVGDTLFYVAALCNSMGKSMEEIAEMNIEKLEDRKKRDVLTSGSGSDR